jgi:hypothetical protein
MKSKKKKLLEKNPSYAAKAEHRGEKTREGAKCVVGLLEWMKHGRGIKGRNDKSRGMEILMTEAFAKINPTDPLILAKQAEREKRNWPDSSGITLARPDASRWASRINKRRKSS